MRSIAVLIFFVTTFFTQAQVLRTQLDGSEQGMLLSDFLIRFQQDHTVRFFFLPQWFDHIRVDGNFKGRQLKDALQEILWGTDITFSEWYGYAVIFYKDPSRDMLREERIDAATQQKIKINNIIIGDPIHFKPDRNVILWGVITDAESKLPLAGASGYIDGTESGFSADEKGTYRITLPAGEHLLSFSFVNHEEKFVSLKIYDNGALDIALTNEAVTLQEVVVSDQLMINKNVGQLTLRMTDLKRTPSFLGIADVIKQVQTQPGVTTTSEASSGFNVRGGSVDQNLVLFDGTPVFNTSHALGFFTAFNAEAINQVTFYKGGIPAEFGGRASSVLNISSKEGDYQKWHGSGGAGLIAADVVLGGPVKKDTSSLAVSFRSSYSDWILKTLRTRFREIQKGSVFFLDGSLKYTHKLTSQSKLTLSSYISSDKFKLANDTTNVWQNVIASLRYNHTINNNLFYSIGFFYGTYTYHVQENNPLNAFDLRYRISYPSLKIDFNREGLTHKQIFGFQTTLYTFNPGELTPASDISAIPLIKMPVERSFETALYGDDAFHLGRFAIDLGFRLSIYNRIGPGEIHQYLSGKPLTPSNEIGSTSYAAGEVMKTYVGPEPRVAIKISVSEQSSLKFGYNRIYQYVHLISNTATVTPVDIWQSSNTYFKPQRADQLSLGYFRNSHDNSFEFSVEGFYKSISNLLDFKDGVSLILNSALETSLLSGIGKAYGAELSIDKHTGRLVGSLNYTYSRSLRKVNGPADSEKINNGDWYPANYDQPNVININWRYSITKRVFLTGAFTYHTGRPVSLPVSGYIIDNVPVTGYSLRNNYRIPDYHRFDIALVIEGSPRKKKRWEGNWVVSLYNVYGRKNPYSLFFVDQGGGVLKPYQLSLVGTIVPSVTYRFKF